MKINIISACDPNSVIGVNGKLPFHIPDDLCRFRELTIGHAVIMGRKTWDSLPVKPLLNRFNIIVTSKPLSKIGDRLYAHSLDNALLKSELRCFKAFIIGGERLYTEALPLADRVYLTLVDAEVDVGAEDTVARFLLADMQALFRMESENKRNGFTFTEWVRQDQNSHATPGHTA